MHCNLPPSRPDRRAASQYVGAQGAMSGSNLAQPVIQQLQQPAYQQVQQPNMLMASQPVIQNQPIFQQAQQPNMPPANHQIIHQLPQIMPQPSVQSHQGIQCANCHQMGHISGMCPARLR